MFTSDFLVIGSGMAGLLYALEVAEAGTVTILTKRNPEEGNTVHAQGGIAGVISPLDSFEAHIDDTIVCGQGLCNPVVVRMVVTEAPERIQHLVELGTNFDYTEESKSFELGREGGHSARRILHAKDQTGAEIHRAVYAKACKHPNITILRDHLAIDLIRNALPNGRTEILGAYAFDRNLQVVKAFSASITMLATGGVGKVYLYTSNPDISTGDGVAMAYRAGAKIANMEFIQFHPTCLYHPQAKSFLLSEALRGEGAKLRRLDGEEFLHRYHEMRELAPRDVVALAIDHELKKTGHDYVLLDISHKPAEFIRNRFPTLYRKTKEFGFDMTKEPVPVVPAAHYCCGGVLCDLNGQTNLLRLYVAGEAACTGLHGANRLASNSLLEAAVFAHRAAVHTLSGPHELGSAPQVPEWNYLDTVQSSEEVLVSHTWDEVRRLMWNLVGIVRNDDRLTFAKRRIRFLKREIRTYYWRFMVTGDLLELRNIIQVAEIIIFSALYRRESRGLHYNTDCPRQDDSRKAEDTVVERSKTGPVLCK